jgi:hypothetical protein
MKKGVRIDKIIVSKLRHLSLWKRYEQSICPVSNDLPRHPALGIECGPTRTIVVGYIEAAWVMWIAQKKSVALRVESDVVRARGDRHVGYCTPCDPIVGTSQEGAATFGKDE